MLTWHRDIEKTTNTLQVVRLVREYLAALSASDFARIPRNCLPGHVIDESDISRYSERLTQEYWRLRGTQADLAVLQEVWSFFMRASIQIARLNELPRSKRPARLLRPSA
jgi:hypothetical protein